jgi:hypothetical protein
MGAVNFSDPATEKKKRKKGGGASFATAATQFNFEEENLMKGDGLFFGGALEGGRKTHAHLGRRRRETHQESC